MYVDYKLQKQNFRCKMQMQYIFVLFLIANQYFAAEVVATLLATCVFWIEGHNTYISNKTVGGVGEFLEHKIAIQLSNYVLNYSQLLL